MAKNTKAFVQDFAFYEQLWNYYASNRGKIRSRYNDLTKKFLAYNDKNENPDAFLRTPQFEALEMYVFIKEFMNNAHMFQMFDGCENLVYLDLSYFHATSATNTTSMFKNCDMLKTLIGSDSKILEVFRDR